MGERPGRSRRIDSFTPPFVDTPELGRSLWVDRVPEPHDPLTAGTEADVVVVGGGFTGLATALALKTRHPMRSVLLLEAAVCGHGASGRNAGMVLSQAGVEPEVLEEMLGPDRARLTLQLLGQGLERMEELARRHGGAGSFERTGSIALGRNERHARAHRAAVGAYRRLGLEAEALDTAAVRRMINSPLYRSGFHVPHTTALIDPWKVLRGLLRAALAAGVRIHEATPVLRIEPGETHRIGCAAGTVTAPALMLATNGYSSRLGFFRNRVAPVHVSCIATEPLDAARRASLGWAGRQSAWEEGWLYHFFRLTPDDRVLLGGGWAVYRMGDRLDHPRAPAVYRRLESALRTIFPQLGGTRITHRWSGPVGFTRDFLPSIGTTGRHRNIYYAVGYTGHGVAMSQLAADILCDLYSGERSAATGLFLVDRRLKSLLFDPLKWMVITAVRNGYLMLDRIGL